MKSRTYIAIGGIVVVLIAVIAIIAISGSPSNSVVTNTASNTTQKSYKLLPLKIFGAA